MIAWKSLAGSDVDTAGSVHFRGVGDGRTEVRVALKYDPPRGKVGVKLLEWAEGSRESQGRDVLAWFKQVAEVSDRVRTK